jgi:hypothetical protein
MFIVEDGTGIARANSYSNVPFADAYHYTRNNTSWASAAISAKQAALVKATDYIEQRWGISFKGSRLYNAVDITALGFFSLDEIPSNDETVTLGATTYTFKTTLTPAANEVLIGVDAAASIANLIAAINAATGAGTLYGAGTTANASATAELAYASALIATAITAGTVGNDVATTTTAENGAWSGTTLENGEDDRPQPLSFPRYQLYDDDGNLVTLIPEKLKQATAEYALRALSAALYVEPTVDERGLRVTGVREKVGPIETETSYAENNTVEITKAIPAADKLLSEYIVPQGKVIRA